MRMTFIENKKTSKIIVQKVKCIPENVKPVNLTCAYIADKHQRLLCPICSNHDVNQSI
jgi:hypothetical protein